MGYRQPQPASIYGVSNNPQRQTNNNNAATLAGNSSQQVTQGADLTGQVIILSVTGQTYRFRIGGGSFADVYKGQYRRGFVAVKTFRGSPTDGQEKIDKFNRRLIRESNIWFRLNHPNIQPYLGHCSDLDIYVALVSPLCGHGSIVDYLPRNPTANKLKLVKDVVNGLEYLHSKNVIHADLHCRNVLVDDSGNARLTDFGRAKVIGELGYNTASVAGCAAYMAPELLATAEVNVDELFSMKSDIYAFAMLCQKVFTNEEPFAGYRKQAAFDYQIVALVQHGKRPIMTPHVQTSIRPEMWSIMEACWQDDPDNRPSAGHVARRMG